MTKKQRIEDLGVVAVMIENILQHELFQEEWFIMNQKNEKQVLIQSFIDEVNTVEESLWKVLEVAKGEENGDDPGEGSHSTY